MKLMYTDDSKRRLANSIVNLVEELAYPLYKALEIEQDLHNQAAALKENPRLGQFEEELAYLNKGHRGLVVGNFKIIYRISGSEIYITDFFDTRQDPSKMKG